MLNNSIFLWFFKGVWTPCLTPSGSRHAVIPSAEACGAICITYPSRGQIFHSSEWNLERTSNTSQSTHPTGRTSALGRITQGSHITYYSLMFFIAYAFKGQVHVFAGWVKIVSHSSCRTSAILKYLCPLPSSLKFNPVYYTCLSPPSKLGQTACCSLICLDYPFLLETCILPVTAVSRG